MQVQSQNFRFLKIHDPKLERLGGLAERYFSDDPSTSLIKSRQFAELLAGHAAARASLAVGCKDLQGVCRHVLAGKLEAG